MILENKCLNIRDVSWDFLKFFNFYVFLRAPVIIGE